MVRHGIPPLLDNGLPGASLVCKQTLRTKFGFVQMHLSESRRPTNFYKSLIWLICSLLCTVSALVEVMNGWTTGLGGLVQNWL